MDGTGASNSSCLSKDTRAVDVLHPLSKLTQEWLNCRDTPHFRNTAQPVLLDGRVYVPGWSGGQSIIWHYSIPDKFWSTLSLPQDIDVSRSDYAITMYQSKLLFIGGYVKTSDIMRISWNKKVYTLDENSDWKVTGDISNFSQMLNSNQTSLLATSTNNYLLVVLKNDPNSTVLIFDGRNWNSRIIPYRLNYAISVIALNGMLYLAESCTRFFYCISVESLLSEEISFNHMFYMYSKNLWKNLCSFPKCATNFTIFGSCTTCTYITVVVDMTPNTSCILAFHDHTNSWVELGKLNFNSEVRPTIVGLPPGVAGGNKLILMGHIRVEKGPQNQVLQRQFDILEVTARVLSYDPDGRISLSSLMKLEKCTEKKVLTELQNSSQKRELLKIKARFSLSSKSIQLPDLYTNLLAAVACIKSWIDDKNAALPPTWRNLLCILREADMQLGSVADDIEKYLELTVGETSNPVPEKPCTCAEELAKLRSQLVSWDKELADTKDIDKVPLQNVTEKVKACLDSCNSAFKKLAEEKQEHAQLQLQAANLTNLTDQGQPPLAKRPRLNDKPSLPVALRLLLPVASSWKTVGVFLGVSKDALDMIESDKKEVRSCLLEMLSTWLKQVSPEPSWGALAYSVEPFDEECAQKLRKTGESDPS